MNVEELLVDWENDHVNNWDANNLLNKTSNLAKNDISQVQFIIIIL